MKHGNQVILQGWLTGVVDQRTTTFDGRELPALTVTVETDAAEMGGRHRVALYGDKAHKAVAYLRANEGAALQVLIHGWLYTQEHTGVVVAEQVTFHSPEELRDRAEALLGKFQAGEVKLRRSRR